MNKEDKKIYMKAWWDKHPLEKKKYDKGYYKKNKEELIEKATEWNKKNREYHRKYDKKWRLNNPNKSREAYLKRTYKITQQEYELLKEFQEGKCGICGEKVNRLVIDHCHNSKNVRGLLCTTCNAGLGQFKDDIKLLNKAIEYLKNDTPRKTKRNSKMQ